MLWILVLCFGATIIDAAPSPEILDNSIEFNDDVINDPVELSDTVKPSLNFNEPSGNYLPNVEILSLGGQIFRFLRFKYSGRANSKKKIRGLCNISASWLSCTKWTS